MDCTVGQWSNWSTCEVILKDCGAGRQKRSRRIATPKSGGGTACPVLNQTRKCTVPCPKPKGHTRTLIAAFKEDVILLKYQNHNHIPNDAIILLSSDNCTLSQWSKWSECTKTCDGGSTIRRRSGEGENCPHLSEARKCKDNPCPGHISLLSANHRISHTLIMTTSSHP